MIAYLTTMTRKPPPSSSESALLVRAVAGEEAALEELIQRYETAVYALCRAILKRPEQAEDATQETFLRMIESITRLDCSHDGFQAWLLRIARNVSISLWRKQRIRGETGFDSAEVYDDAAAVHFQARSPLESLVADEMISRIHASLDALPGPLREVLVLRFCHQLKTSEIARVVGIQPGNARVRLTRAVQEMRRVVEADGVGNKGALEQPPSGSAVSNKSQQRGQSRHADHGIED